MARTRKSKAKEAAKVLDNDYVGAVAASEFGTEQRYGEILSGMYDHATDAAPNPHAYRLLFRDAIKSKSDFLNMPRLQAKAAEAVKRAVNDAEVAEVLRRSGVMKDPSQEHDGKYVGELTADQKAQMEKGYIDASTHQYAIEALDDQRGKIAKGLERAFCSTRRPPQPPRSPQSPSKPRRRPPVKKKASPKKKKKAAKKSKGKK